MTSKEKAKDLYEKMSSQTYKYQPYAGANYEVEEIGWEAGKKCTIIMVDEIISESKNYEYGHPILLSERIDYWEEVKIEIELL